MAITTLVTTPQAEGTATTPTRSDGYLNAWVSPLSGKEWGAVAEGNYFTAISPTSGTGLLGHAAPTSFDQTKAFIYGYNAGTKTIYPQQLILTETAASVGGTTGGLRIVPVIDFGNRYTASGGTALTVSNNNSASGNTSGFASTIWGAAPVLSAATANARNFGDVVFRQTTIDIIGDKFTIVFGGVNALGNSASIPATLAEFSTVLPPLAIGPGASIGFHIWRASMSTGPTLEIQFGYIER